MPNHQPNLDLSLTAIRKRFRDSSEPFAITAGGEKLYIVTDPTDVSAVYKNTITLSWDAFLGDLLTAFGVNAMSIPKLWEKCNLDFTDGKGPNKVPRGLSAIHSTLDLYKRQLHPGEKMDKFSEVLMGHINSSLRWEKLSQRGFLMGQVSLKDFCAEVLVDALTRTMFGDRILEVEPEIIRNLLNFNDDAWMLIFHYPQSPASKLNQARNKVLEGLINYMQGPDGTRPDRAWLIQKIMEEQKILDISDKDKAALLLMTYWG